MRKPRASCALELRAPVSAHLTLCLSIGGHAFEARADSDQSAHRFVQLRPGSRELTLALSPDPTVTLDNALTERAPGGFTSNLQESVALERRRARGRRRADRSARTADQTGVRAAANRGRRRGWHAVHEQIRRSAAPTLGRPHSPRSRLRVPTRLFSLSATFARRAFRRLGDNGLTRQTLRPLAFETTEGTG
jgi:hypothetical protein